MSSPSSRRFWRSAGPRRASGKSTSKRSRSAARGPTTSATATGAGKRSSTKKERIPSTSGRSDAKTGPSVTWTTSMEIPKRSGGFPCRWPLSESAASSGSVENTIMEDVLIFGYPMRIRGTSTKMPISWAKSPDSLVATRKRKKKLRRPPQRPPPKKKQRRKRKADGLGKNRSPPSPRLATRLYCIHERLLKTTSHSMRSLYDNFG
mmetsp:Transcript_10978/g.26394  ORF Transcript_10978/g.26394 Transcript_10978/m.26394 type:complete len:206 (+) Transcript_10978:334-951(+)